jgi:quercetin dioxygenase-like cupin family protein
MSFEADRFGIGNGNRVLRLRRGEELTVLRSGADNGGKLFEVDSVFPPGVSGPPPHVHTRETESFTVLKGRLWVRSGRNRFELRAGQTATVPPETVHSFANRSAKPVVFRTVSTPAGILEQLLLLQAETGRTPILRVARLNHGENQTLFFPGVPRPVQRVLWNALAALTRPPRPLR